MSPLAAAIQWSPEHAFESRRIESNVPHSPGVYEILQSPKYPRYAGETRVLKIGCSKADLRAELSNHLIRHAAANRLTRVRNQADVRVSFRYAVVGEAVAVSTEKSLLRDFEDEHWDLPLLNCTRGYERGADMHYRDTVLGRGSTSQPGDS